MGALLALDPQLLDDPPPFFCIGLHKRTEGLRCLSLARENLHSELNELRLDRWIGQCLHGRRIELVDYVPWRVPWREKPVPGGVGKRRQSHLADGREFGCLRQT